LGSDRRKMPCLKVSLESDAPIGMHIRAQQRIVRGCLYCVGVACRLLGCTLRSRCRGKCQCRANYAALTCFRDSISERRVRSVPCTTSPFPFTSPAIKDHGGKLHGKALFTLCSQKHVKKDRLRTTSLHKRTLDNSSLRHHLQSSILYLRRLSCCLSAYRLSIICAVSTVNTCDISTSRPQPLVPGRAVLRIKDSAQSSRAARSSLDDAPQTEGADGGRC
jgi:hypothetical protein